TYIGPSWNDNRNYQIGMTLTDHWIYGTLGSGLERDLGRYFSVSADFRFRFASGNNELLSISDTGFFFGASWNLRKRLPQSAKNNNASNRRTNNQKRSRVYKWLKSRRSS
ncbi:MAG TPA: hypothetical protein VL651_03510, partial [Bacteroidia bacterium]|nr:hypothetical protein [Bacteroidia bacterium]